MLALRLCSNILAFSLPLAGLIACGGSVGDGNVGSGSSTGGLSFTATGGGGYGAEAAGGSSGMGVGGSAGSTSTLPTKCLYAFDPGTACNSPVLYYIQYDQSLGRCVTVQYNGCGGATSGTFTDLGTCQALCEQRPADATCPVRYSPSASCSVDGAVCSYSMSQCLCAYLDTYSCRVPDPRCATLGLNSTSNTNAPCPGDICTSTLDIVIASQYVCTCTGGAWQCSVFNGW